MTSTDAAATGSTAVDGRTTFRPWHFFVVLTLLAATVAVLTARKVTPEYLIMLSVTVFAAGGAALAFYRTLLPLVGRERRLSTESLGHRARAALEREKALVLRSIKELEFDRAMQKVAPEDFDDMSQRLRARALRIMQQLDAAVVAPRERLERELAERLAQDGASRSSVAPERSLQDDGVQDSEIQDGEGQDVVCTACGVANDSDARFCKACGTRLTGEPVASSAARSGERERA